MIERTLLDVNALRQDFPALRRLVHGRPLVYLDNAATSQKPEAVLRALDEYYREHNANVHRGIHTLAEEATALYEGAREKVARFINAPGPAEVVFTKSSTEALNLVAYGWAYHNLREGDEVVVTVMEHHSNLVPWQLACRRTGARLRHLDIDDEGYLRLDQLDEVLSPRTRLVAVTHVSNVLGTINPVAEITRRARAAGALVVVDGSQAAPQMPVDVQALGCDFYALTGHKMLGPTGVGALWGRRALLEAMEPFLGGGEMIKNVRLEDAEWNEVPHKFEAGTPNIAQAIGLGAAVDYLQAVGMDNVRVHERELTAHALEALATVPGVTVYGPREVEHRGGAVTFSVEGIHPHDLATVLDQEFGVAIRAGHHCAQPLMNRLGVLATARASFYLYNLPEEADRLVEGIRQAQRLFGV